MPTIKGEGWRIEIAVKPKEEHKFVCENPGCGISYFNPNIFALHLEAHGLPEFSNTLVDHPVNWKQILILQSVQSEYESMSKSFPDSSVLKPLLAHLIEASPVIAQDFGIGIFCNAENLNLLLEPSSCDRVQCMITFYLNSIRVCCRRNGRNEVSQEISGLAEVWNLKNWSAGEMERKKQVTKLRDWLQLEQQRADLMDKQTWIEKRADEIYFKWQGGTLHGAQENEQANQSMHAEVAIGEEEEDDDEIMVIEPINAKVQDRSSQHQPDGHPNTHEKLPLDTEQNTFPVQQIIQHNAEDKSLVFEVANKEPALPDKPPMFEMLAAQVEEENKLWEQAPIVEPEAERLIAEIDLNRVQMKECNDEAFPVADENTERMEDHHSGVMPETLIGADPEPTSKTGVHRRKVMPSILCASLSYGTRYMYQHVTRRRRLILKQNKKPRRNKRKVNRKGDL